jgi:1-hydroxy-2-naphthoate dioxygenase
MATGDAMAAFDEKLSKANIYGQWKADAFLQQVTDGPRPAGGARLWRWDDVSALLEEACIVMPASVTARRSLMFSNPELERRGTTHTIAMGMQMIRPGEVAWAHRHSINALRFVIKGNSDLYTVVDGEPAPMENYDLVLTPGWAWHDHHNETGGNAVWLDVLDVPLVLALNQPFYEAFGDETQPVLDVPKSPSVRYAWADMEKKLHAGHDDDGGDDGVFVEYVNPITGGPVLPTLSCWAQWLKPGFETKPNRRTSSAVYHVVKGSGRTKIGDRELFWGAGDSFCIPNWAHHHHSIDGAGDGDGAILFSVHDTPLLKALGMFFEETTSHLGGQSIPAPRAGK